MTDKHVQSEAPHTNMEKDPSTWVTGGEEMTGAQMSYLKTLSEQAGVELDESLTKAEASERIEELQQQTGRGAVGGHGAAEHTSHAAPKAKPVARADAEADAPPDTSGTMTGAQMSYLKTLSEQAGVDFDESLTKAEASERIDALQQQTGRGASHAQAAAPAHGHAAKAHAAPKAKAAATTADDEAADASEDPRAADDDDLFAAETTAAKPARR